MAKHYDEKSIQVMVGLEGVRKKPTVYIGSLGTEGVLHSLREIVENSVDEAMAKENDFVGIEVETDSEKKQIFTVTDYGRGIPIEIHPKTKISTLTTIFTHLHAGGKFDNKAYSNGKK